MRRAPHVPTLVLTIAAALAFTLGACGPEPEAGQAGKGDGPAPAKPGAAVPAPAPSSAAKLDRAALAASYDRALDYLAKARVGDGWASAMKPDAADPSITAMVLTGFLERPGGVRDADRALVDSALAYVAGQVDEQGVKGAQTPNYSISVTIGALTAAGLPAHRPLIDGLVKNLRTYQFLDAKDPSYGGIGYGSDKTRSDLSNTQFALASLRAAGIPPTDPAFQAAVTYLQRVQNRKENEGPGEPTEWTDWTDKDKKNAVKTVRSNDGGANYLPGNSKAGFDTRPDGVNVLRSYGSMTYALLRCYHLAGVDGNDPRVQAAVRWIEANWTLDRNPGMPEKQAGEGLYYMYMTMGKALSASGKDTLAVGGKPLDWRTELATKLQSSQLADGSWINPASARWMEGDPAIATAYSLSALAACAK